MLPPMRPVAIATLSLLLAAPAHAETVLECGVFEGQSYYLKGGIIAETGWMEDSMGGGALRLVKEGETYDLLVVDGAGQKSLREFGMTLTLLAEAQGKITISAADASTVETYIFDPAGGEAVLARVMAIESQHGASLFRADCN